MKLYKSKIQNTKPHDAKWPYIPGHSYRILIIGSSGSRKKTLLNLTNHETNTEAKFEAKYQLLTNKLEKVGLKRCNDSKAFLEYSNDMQDVYKNIDGYNPGQKCKILIVFADVIADMISNKKLNSQ